MMQGHVVKRKSNRRWYVSLELPRNPETGSRRRRSLGGYDTRTEAREALRHALDEARRGWQGPERVSVAEYLREWLDGVELERAPTTSALYKSLLEHHVIPRIGGERLQRVTPAMLTSLYSELLKAYSELLKAGSPRGRALSAKSVRNVHTTVRKALADAVASRRLDWNPAEAAKVPRSRRTIALDTAAVTALKRHKAAQASERLVAGSVYMDGGRIFADEIGRALSPDGVSKNFGSAVKRSGLPKLTLHGLRHCFATLGLEAGVDTLYLSEILGHSSPAITPSAYQHTRSERLAAAVRQVGDVIYGRAEAGRKG